MFRNWWPTLAALVVLIVVLFAAVTCDSPAEDEPEKVDITQFGGSSGGRELVEHLDELIDRMPAEASKLPVSDSEVLAWELEILPYFAYEGLVNYPVTPAGIQLTPYLDAMQHNHILGRAYCAELPGYNFPKIIELNVRTGNPNSAWFMEADRFLPTLVHEMIHIQGVCEHGEASETATQVVTLETLAAMVNHGNAKALWPLLVELRDIAMASEMIRARSAGEEEFAEFEEWRSDIMGDAFEDARHAKSQRFWNQDYAHQIRLSYILRAYNGNVWDHLQYAFANEGITRDMFLPFYAKNEHLSRMKFEYDGTRSFEVDDLIYFIENAEGLVEDYERR